MNQNKSLNSGAKSNNQSGYCFRAGNQRYPISQNLLTSIQSRLNSVPTARCGNKVYYL